MKKLLTITIFSFVNLLFFSNVDAQTQSTSGQKFSNSNFSFSLYPGVYLNGVSQRFASGVGNTQLQNTLENMYMFGVRVGHGFTPEWEAELDFFFSPTVSGGFSLFSYFSSVNAVYNIGTPSPSIVPYLIGGPGLLYNNIEQISSESLFGLGLGAGVKFFVTPKFAVRPEIRLIGTFDSFNAAVAGSLMLTYYGDFLKRGSDTDFDGIVDRSDKCPSDRETFNGYQDADGCPDVPPVVDTDGDGIIDSQDKCPTEKETVNAYLDEDGCPDTAPAVPPAFVEPTPSPTPFVDPDSDGDGIPDSKDQCPKEKETYNNYLDNDGCSDSVPKELKSFAGKVDGIYFATGSAIIERRSYKMLDLAVGVFKKYPNLQVKVDGHTDSTGSKKTNTRLSKERAEAVRQYLASRGVDANRVQIEGFGSSKPVASNATSTGRSQNRRIEFKLQEKDKTPTAP